MSSGLSAALSRAYLVVALLAAALAGPGQQPYVALALLLLHGAALARPPHPRLDLPFTVASLLLLPWLLSPLAGPLLGVVALLPALPLPDGQLRRLDVEWTGGFRQGQRTTPRLHALALALAATGVLGLAVGTPALAGAAGVLLAGVMARAALEVRALRASPLSIAPGRLRALAGTRREVSLEAASLARVPLRARLAPAHRWLALEPRDLALDAGQSVRVDLAVTAPLAGPTAPPLLATVTGPWGLVAAGYSMTPLELHVVPRARYAAWLARRYLQATGERGGALVAGAERPLLGRTRGTEYQGLREYQAGDRLRDIDWRHTLKLRELVVKERMDQRSGEAALLVNMAVSGPEEADWVAYHTVMTVLSAARHGVPVSIAAYTQGDVFLARGPLQGREALKDALRLSARLVPAPSLRRLLDAPDVPRLRRSLRHPATEGVSDGAVLRTLLRLELGALEEAALRHPLGPLVGAMARRMGGDAIVTVVSRWNHDFEALSVLLPLLRSRGYQVLDLLSRRGPAWT